MAAANYADEELVDLLRSGKGIDVPVRFFYENHFNLVAAYIEQNHGNRQDAEDIFQEVVLTVINSIRGDKFRGEASVKTFIYSVARNLWLNELKKRGRQEKRNKLFFSTNNEPLQEVQQVISKRESRKQVMSVIESLGEACRKILVAFYYENRSMQDIVGLLGYQNEQVTRNKKSKCMKSLAEKLEEDPLLAQQLKSALNYE